VSYFYNKALAFDPNNIEAALQTANMYEQLQYYDHAKALYIHVLQVSPNNEKAISALDNLSGGAQ
jgi:Tfp pilus assembly protein PilF